MPLMKIFLPASEMTKCLWCKTNNRVVFQTTDTIRASWDTRSPLDPKAKVEAHESEILAVAFSPANEHLLITGSADKVCICLYCSLSDLLIQRSRWFCMTFESLPNDYTSLSLIQTKSFILLGPRTILPFLHPLPVIDVSTSGIYPWLDKNRPQMIKKMVHPNCFSFMVVCLFCWSYYLR